MSHWTDIREKARFHHAQLLAHIEGDYTAEDLLWAAEKSTDISRAGLPQGHPLLDGGEAALDLEAQVIWYNQDVNPSLAAFYQVHEFAHYWMHSSSFQCEVEDIDPGASEEPVPLGIERVEGYSPHERREREANIFAREFLLPVTMLRAWFSRERMSAEAIASRVGVPKGMVLHQMSRALLINETVEQGGKEEEEKDPEAALQLDPSQERAAHEEHGPVLVEAGPGTGKTRTLTARIAYLLGQGVDPRNILALTFSNKAAEEMRERVALVRPVQAPHIWMGTFHAFGLELLRKYHKYAGLPPTPMVLDPVDASFLLEDALVELELDHYQNLYEPGLPLRDILSAVSRAKDELVSPARYSELAGRMLAKAEAEEDPNAVETAQKALEIARVYAFYQNHLESHGMLDFGDLIYRSVLLLREHSEVQDWICEDYHHILVDEYQDVNRASGLFLKEIAGDGKGLWVVGDTRQAIYRFRGASTTNMRRFTTDYDNVKGKVKGHPLRTNYRSQQPVVDVFAELAPQMKATADVAFEKWEVYRGTTDGQVLMHVAEDDVAEGIGIARTIKERQAAGVPLREQAVLCRSHTLLARIATTLEEEGVPVLYLGDVFERPEIRDLLSLVAFTTEPDGKALVRVARFPEYDIPLADVLTLRAKAREAETRFPDALALAEDDEDLSEKGQQGFARLARHLEGFHFGTNAWRVLADYLFDRSQYLDDFLDSDSVNVQQRCLAIYQLLQFAHEFRERPGKEGEDPKNAFLQYIRRLAMSGEDRQLRQVPEWADGLDAVRLLTIHASKGLEFDTVYVPALASTYFPVSARKRACRPPDGMIAQEEEHYHDEEEECLFFVALSRAQNVLCLSRAQRYGKVNRKPSKLLSLVETSLRDFADLDPTWLRSIDESAKTTSDSEAGKLHSTDHPFEERELSVYFKCPRRYFYEFVLGLGGWDEESAYLQFHRCVYSVLRQLQDQRMAGGQIDMATSLRHLDEQWQQSGPTDHAYERFYRHNAEQMVRRAVARAQASGQRIDRPEWAIELEYGEVTFRPDAVAYKDGALGRTVQRWRTGRPTKSEIDKPVYALYHTAAQEAHPEGCNVEVVFLSTDEVQSVEMTQKKIDNRLGKYNEAIKGILAGDFTPQPSPRECPKCPYYFICPAAEDDCS